MGVMAAETWATILAPRRMSERADANNAGEGDQTPSTQNDDGQTFAPSGAFALPRGLINASQPQPKKKPAAVSATRGRQTHAVQSNRGLSVGIEKPIGPARDISLSGTLRAAALRKASTALSQPESTPLAHDSRSGAALAPAPQGPPLQDHLPLGQSQGLPLQTIRVGDLRVKKRRAPVGNLLLFVVDSSGSMGARKRMSLVKGAMLTLLLDAYQKRDFVGLIVFRGAGARLLVPPTNSVEVAERQLRQLPTGGRTPLGDGLRLAAQTLQRYERRAVALDPLVVLLTDGRANAGPDPLAAGGWLVQQQVPTLVIDSEQGYVRLGAAAQLADQLGARYVSIDALADRANDGRRLRELLTTTADKMTR